jgi:hypothetical protein
LESFSAGNLHTAACRDGTLKLLILVLCSLALLSPVHTPLGSLGRSAYRSRSNYHQYDLAHADHTSALTSHAAQMSYPTVTGALSCCTSHMPWYSVVVPWVWAVSAPVDHGFDKFQIRNDTLNWMPCKLVCNERAMTRVNWCWLVVPLAAPIPSNYTAS